MGRRVVVGVLSALLGYAVGAVGGGFLVSLLSSNVHDQAVEAAMTGAFVLGPLGAVAGLVAGILRGGRRPGRVPPGPGAPSR